MQRNRENLPNGSKAEECEILSYPKHCSKKAEGGGLEITEAVETNGHSVMCSVQRGKQRVKMAVERAG